MLLTSSLAHDQLPAWGGRVDVIVAFTLVVTPAWTLYLAHNGIAGALRPAHAVGATVPAICLAAIWDFRGRIDLNTLLPGRACQTFLELVTLPSAIAVWRRTLTL